MLLDTKEIRHIKEINHANNAFKFHSTGQLWSESAIVDLFLFVATLNDQFH